MANFVRLFKPQFAAAVAAGTKRQTVRPMPHRMPEAGDGISLRTWTGLPFTGILIEWNLSGPVPANTPNR